MATFLEGVVGSCIVGLFLTVDYYSRVLLNWKR